MKDKTKAIMCLGGMVAIVMIGMVFDIEGTMPWFGISALGFGWYARGRVDE